MATKASSYIKNVGKSLGYATIDVLKEYNPIVTSFIENNKDITAAAYKEIKQLNSTMAKMKNSTKSNKYISAAKTVANSYRRNLFEDIKSGNFYNKERESKIESEVGEAYMAGMDADFGFEDFDDSSWDDDSLSDTDRQMSMMDVVGEKVSNAVVSATARSAEYIVASNQESTEALMQQQNAIYTNLHMGMGTINENLGNILNFYTDVAATHYKNSQTYYTNTESILREQTDLLKQLVEYEKKKLGEDKKKSSSYGSDKVTFTSLNNYDGAISLKDYGKYILERSKNEYSMVSDLLGMIDQMGGLENFGKMLTVAPLRSATKGAVRFVMGKNLKKSMENFNESLSGLFGNIMANLEDMQGGFGIKSKIADFFGINSSIKNGVSSSNYEKGPIPFDGVTKKAIVDVMPHYLSKIYSAISGEPETRFDFNSGKYVKMSGVNKQFKSIKTDAARSMVGELDYAINTVARSLNMSPDEQERFEKEKEKLYSYMLRNGFKKFNENRRKGKTIVSPTIYGGNGSDEESKRFAQIFQMMYNQLSDKQITQLNTSRYTNIDRINDTISRIETESGNPIMELFSDGYEESNTKDTVESARRTFINIPQFGQATLDYLYSINKELSFIREFGLGVGLHKVTSNTAKAPDFNRYKPGYDKINLSGSSHAPGKMNTNSILNMSDSEWSQLQKNAMEQYSESQKARQNLYDDDKGLIASFLGISDDHGIGKLVKSVSDIVTKPANVIAGVVDTVDRRMFNLLFNVEGESNEVGGIVPYIMKNIKEEFHKADNWVQENIIDSVKGKLTKENIKEKADKFLKIFNTSTDEIHDYFFDKENGVFGKNFKNGLIESFKGVGRFFRDKILGIFGIKSKYSESQSILNDVISGSKKKDDGTGEVENAASGLRRVKKTGVIAVSRGEMIVPPDFDTNKIKNRTFRENAEKLKYYKNYGINPDSIDNYAAGGKYDFAHMSEKEARRILSTEGLDIFLDSKEGIECLINNRIKTPEQIKKSIKYRKNSDAWDRTKDKFKNAYSTTKDYIKSEADFLIDWATKGDRSGVDNQLDKIKDFTKKAMDEMKDKYPNMITGGIIGAGVSAITGMVGGPLLGAAVGAGTGLLASSNKLQNILFGDPNKLDEFGNRTDYGLFNSKTISDFVRNNLPNTAAGAAIGGLASFIPGMPGGPVAGIIIGSAVGFASTNERIKTLLFGDEEDGFGGLIDKKKLMKALPAMGLGAVAGAVVGPFGLIPNIMLGAGAGLLTTNEKFREYLFGDDGLLTYYRDRITQSFDPITDYIKKHIADGAKFIRNKFSDLIDNHIRRPIVSFINEKFLSKINTTLGNVGEAVKTVLKFPADIIGNIGERARVAGIKGGYAQSMTAVERLMYRDKNSDKFKKGDKYAKADEILASMSQEELQELKTTYDYYQNAGQAAKAGLRNANRTMSDINTDYRLSNNGVAIKLFNAYRGKAPSDDKSIRKIIFADNGLSEKDKKDLYAKFTGALKNRDRAKAALNDTNQARSQSSQIMRDIFGDDIYENVMFGKVLDTEINSRDNNKKPEDIPGTPEYQESLSRELTDKVVNKLDEIKKLLEPKKDDNQEEKDSDNNTENNDEEELSEDNNIVDAINNEGNNKKKKFTERIKDLVWPETKTINDSEGRPIKMIRVKDGKFFKYVQATNDSETDNTLSEQQEENNREIAVANNISETSSFLGKISKFLGIGDDEEEGETLADRFATKFHIKGIWKWIKIAGAAIIALGATGILDGLADKISRNIQDAIPFLNTNDTKGNGAFSYGNTLHILGNDGKDYVLQTDENGNPVRDENGNYVDVTGKSVQSNGSPYTIKSGTSFGERSREYIARSFVSPLGTFNNPFSLKNTARNFKQFANSSKTGARSIRTIWDNARGIVSGISDGTTSTRSILGLADENIIGPATGKSSIIRRLTNGLGESADELAESATKSKWIQKITNIISKNLDNWVSALIKKLPAGAQDALFKASDDILKFISKNLGKFSVTELSDIASNAVVVLQIIQIVLDFTEGYQDARSILGIVDEPTIGQRIICGLLEALKNLIPFVGVLIPEKVIVDILMNTVGKAMGMTKLAEQREQAKLTVEAYNKEHGTDYSIEDYNKNVLGDATFFDRGSAFIKNGFNSIKENGLFGSIMKYNVDTMNIIKDIATSDRPMEKISEYLANGGNGGFNLFNILGFLDDLGGAPTQSIMRIQSHMIRGEIKEIWTDGYYKGMKKNPLCAVRYLGLVLPTQIVGTILSVPAYIKNKITEFTDNTLQNILPEDMYNKISKVLDMAKSKSFTEMITAFGFKSKNNNIASPIEFLKALDNKTFGMINTKSEISKSIKDGDLGGLWKAGLSQIDNNPVGGLLTFIGTLPTKIYSTIPTLGHKLANYFGPAIYDSLPEPVQNVVNTASNILKSGHPLKEIGKMLGGLNIFESIAKFDSKTFGVGRMMSEMKQATSSGDVVGLWLAGIDQIAEEPFTGTYTFLNFLPAKLFSTIPTLGTKMLKAISPAVQSFMQDTMGKLRTTISVIDEACDPNVIMEYINSEEKLGKLLTDYYRDSSYSANSEENGFSIYNFIAKTVALPLILTGRLGKKLNDIIQPIKNTFSVIIDAIDSLTDNALTNAASKVKNGLSWLNNTTRSSYSTTKKGAGNVVDAIKSAFGRGSGMYAGGASGVDDTFVSQKDPKYSNIRFNIPGDTQRQTISDTGCGPAVATMAINSIYRNRNNRMSMNKASQMALRYKLNDGGVDATYFKDIFARNGIASNYYTGADRNQNIYKSLYNGEKVILLGQDSTNKSKSTSPYGPDNHYVLATGISKDGKYIYISDPEGRSANKRYRADKILLKSKLGISAFAAAGSRRAKLSLPIKRYFGGGPTGDYIGKYVKKFESGSGGSTTIAHHSGNDGGASYGSYQMIYSVASTFWSKYYASKYGEQSGVSNLEELWLKAANDDPEGFFANEHEFIQSQYYDIAKSKLAGTFDPDKYSRAMQECIWSWAVHRGAGGCVKEFKAAISNSGISNPQTCDEAKLIDACYQYRDKVFSDAGYASSVRYKAGYGDSSEYDTVKALIGQDPIASDGSTITGTATNSSSSSSSSSVSSSGGFIGELTSAFTNLASAWGLGNMLGTSDSSSSSSSSSSSDTDTSDLVGNTIGDKIVNYARKIKNSVVYEYGGQNPPGSTDCSGYVQYVYKNVTGADISRGTVTQMENKDGILQNLNYDQAQPGDLLYWHMSGSTRAADQPSHVGIYLGDGKCIHNSDYGVNVIDNQKLSDNGDMGSGNKLLTVMRLKESAYSGSGSNLARAKSYVNTTNRKNLLGYNGGGSITYGEYAAAGSGLPSDMSTTYTTRTKTYTNKLNSLASNTTNDKIIKLITVIVQILNKISTNTNNMNNIVSLLTTIVESTNSGNNRTTKNSVDIAKIKAQLVETMRDSATSNEDQEIMQLIKSVEQLARE